MKTFQEWLKDKIDELNTVDAQTSTGIIGAVVGAQQPQSPANVADRLAATNAPLAAAIAGNPRVEKIKALVDQKLKKNNPVLQQTANLVSPTVGANMSLNT